MGDSGNASHTKGFEARKKKSADDLAPLVQTAEAWHVVIEEDQVGFLAIKRLQGLVAIAGNDRRVATELNRSLEGQKNVSVVVNDKN